MDALEQGGVGDKGLATTRFACRAPVFQSMWFFRWRAILGFLRGLSRRLPLLHLLLLSGMPLLKLLCLLRMALFHRLFLGLVEIFLRRLLVLFFLLLLKFLMILRLLGS